jgi:hypothetical protein
VASSRLPGSEKCSPASAHSITWLGELLPQNWKPLDSPRGNLNSGSRVSLKQRAARELSGAVSVLRGSLDVIDYQDLDWTFPIFQSQTILLKDSEYRRLLRIGIGCELPGLSRDSICDNFVRLKLQMEIE